MKVLAVFGTRPEAIKMAPLVKELKRTKGIKCVVCVTAQHRQMLDQVLELFNIKPEYDLNIMKKAQSLSDITSGVLKGMDKVIEQENPDLVLVHGDTSTSFVAALSAFYHKVPVGHVEAGLRTYDKYSPYPEEMNRQLTGRIAEYHFAPTLSNKKHLLKEGVKEDNIVVTGNTVIDALLTVSKKPYKFTDKILANLDFKNKRVIAVTCHRRENLGENMANIFSAIADIAKEFSDVEVVYPVHLNPKVQEEARQYLAGLKNVHLIEPLSYQPFVNLMKKSFFILTDSGGMQEEAPALGKPVLVVRKETERPEAIKAGTCKLAGVERETIYKYMKKLLTSESFYKSMSEAQNPYGDGTASKKIAEFIAKMIKN